MTENIRFCVLNARKQKQKFCSYLNDNFDCTTPTYEFDYCIMFLIRLNGEERVESRGSKGESTKDSLKFPNSVRLADSFKDLVDICDYSEPTDAVELKQLARERRL